MKHWSLLLWLLGLTYLCTAQNQVLLPQNYTPDGTVYALQRKGDTMYVGGFFDQVGYRTGGVAALPNAQLPPNFNFPYLQGDIREIIPDGNGGYYVGGWFIVDGQIAPQALLHVESNGIADTSFLPVFNTLVQALAIKGDTLFVGGNFVQVDGQNQPYLAAFDIPTQSQLNWNLELDGRVTDLEIYNGNLIVSGRFDRIARRQQASLALIDLAAEKNLLIPSPTSGYVNDIALWDNRLYVVGDMAGTAGIATGRTAYFPNNQVDADFEFPIPDASVRAIIPDGNGGWYMGGAFNFVSDSARSKLVHILANNSVDPNFQFTVNGTVEDLALQNDSLFVAGQFTEIDGQIRDHLAAIAVNTNTLTAWAPAANDDVNQLLIEGNYLWIGGDFTSVGNDQQQSLARLSRGSGLSTPVPCPASGSIRSLVQSPGQIFVGGTFNNEVGDFTGRLAMFSGSAERPNLDFLNFAGNVEVIIEDGNGGWYVGGAFNDVNGQNQRKLAHILPNLSLDPNFGYTFNNTVLALALSNDTLFVGGNFTNVDGQSRSRIAALDLNNNLLLPWNPQLNGRVNDLLINGDDLLVGGEFTQIDGQTRNRLASFSNSTGLLNAWHPDANNRVYGLLLQGGSLYVHGTFTNIGGQARNRLAQIDLNTGLASTWHPNVNNAVNDIAITGNRLFLGGTFTQVGGQSRRRLASVELSTGNVETWDPDLNGLVNALAIQNDTIIAGGNFTQIGGQTIERLAKLDINTANLNSWNPKPNNQVKELIISGGNLLIGGNFVIYDGQDRSRAFSLNLSDLSLSAWNPDPNGSVEDIELIGGQLALGGNFTNLNGQSRTRLALVDSLTGVPDPWNPTTNGIVYDILPLQDTLFLAGNFDQVNGSPREKLAAIALSNASLLPWSPSANNTVRVLNANSNGLISGGDFQTMQAKVRNHAYAVDLTNASFTDWDPNPGGSGIATEVYTVGFSPNDTVVYIGGVFSNVGGDAVGNIAKVGRSDGKFLSFGAAANGKVLSLSLQDSLLYVGGEFTQLNNQDRQYMGLLAAQSGLLQPFTLTPNSFVKTFLQDSLQTLVGGEFSMSDTRYRSNTYAYDLRTNAILDWAPQTDALVTQIEVSNDGEQIYLQTSSSQPDQMLISVDRNQGLPSPNWNLSLNSNTREIVKDPATGNLYLGGTFTQINGQSRTYLAGIDPNGNLLPLNVSIDDRVEGLALQSGQLYLAGDFGQVANQNRDRLAAVDLNGNLQAWAPAHNTPVFNSLSQVEATPDRIYVAGNFTQISGEDRNHIAALHPIDGNALPWNPRIDEGLLGFQVNFVKPIGQDVMIGGQIKSSAGTTVSGLAQVSALGARLTKAPFPVDYVQLQAVEAYDEKLVVGGNYLRLNDRRHAHISTLDIEAHEEQELILGPHLASYLPLKGGNEGDVTISLRGAGFSPDTRVYLRHNGFNPIIGLDSGRVQHGDALLDVPFVLRGEAPGFRDLVIEIPGDTTIVIPNGFEIEANSRTQVYADVIGRKLARPNARSKFYIQYGNSGNIDAIGVPIWLATSQNLANVRIEYLEISILDTTQAFLDSIPKFVPIDTLWTQEYEANVHAFILPKIAAGSVGIIQFSAEPTEIGPFRMRAWANEPLYGSPLKYWTGECFDTWFGAAIGFVPFAGCAYGALDAALSPTFDLLYDPQFGTSSWATDYMVGVGGTAVGCILDFTTLGVGRVVLETVNEALTVKTTYDVLNKCLTPEDKGDFDGFGVGSFDPNDKTGRQGEGGLGWLRSDQAFPYVIRFENIDTATAPALVVEIRDTLDPTVFDLNSLQLMGFNIADSLYRFVPQRGTQNRIVDLRPRLPYYVEVTTELDILNGEFVCRFLTLDTLTMQAVDDPIGGFLPPNVDGISGTGSIIFSLETQAAIQTGAIMENSAGIYFDTNPPIITNTWRNTIDDDLPRSQIAALTDTLSDLEIPLHWSSSDIGSGVRYFDLYFREDGGPWQVAADQLSDTSFVFVGVAGSFYEFYSIAYDTALNEELPPLQADASTFIDASVGIKDGLDNNFVRLYPNPNDGSFALSFESLKATKVKFSLFNNLGALLHQQEIQLTSGTQTIQQNLNIPSGLYTLRFEIEGKQTVRKMVVY